MLTLVFSLHAVIRSLAVLRGPEVVILVAGEGRAGIGLATLVAHDAVRFVVVVTASTAAGNCQEGGEKDGCNLDDSHRHYTEGQTKPN